MNKSMFAFVTIAIFLLLPFNQVVSADVVEETKVVQIDAATLEGFEYTSIMNIVNTTNDEFTNEKLLIEPFEEKTGVSGMISGSFMPPARFQLDSAIGSFGNQNLILASTVEFNKKNILSGASESWWRCPFAYTYYRPRSCSFDLKMSIYHVDLPRTVNLTFTNPNPLINYPVYPTNTAHPSLVYQKSYTNCGATNNSQQTFVHVPTYLPVNDTLVDSTKPLNTNPSDPDYNDYKYKTPMYYANAWFNVSAPIYPNQSYFVVWEITDLDTFGDAGSVWITASDIGNNGYGRSLMSWNNQTIYELPIDMDISVVFKVGLGAGISGAKLESNEADKQYHTSAFVNPSFETATWSYYDDLDTQLYTPSSSLSTDAWIRNNPSLGTTDFLVNKTGMLLGGLSGQDGNNGNTWVEMYYGTTVPHEVYMNFEITMNDIKSSDASCDYWGSQFKIGLHNSISDRANIIIQRLEQYFLSNDTKFYKNYIISESSGGTWEYYQLPDIVPNHLYVTVQNIKYVTILGVPFYTRIVSLYNADAPNIIFDSHTFSTAPIIATINRIVYSGCAYAFSTPVLTTPSNSVAVTVHRISGIEALDSATGTVIDGWTNNLANTAYPTKVNFGEGMETIVPNFKNTAPANYRCAGFTQRPGTSGIGGIYQYSNVITAPATPRRYFVELDYRMIEKIPEGRGSYFELFFTGYEVSTSSWVTASQVYNYEIDGGWHKVSAGHLVGRFARLYVSFAFRFGWTSTQETYGFVDNIQAYSVAEPTQMKIHQFYQKIDKLGWNSTNYYTFMMPFKYETTPSAFAWCRFDYYDINGAYYGGFNSMPTDFNNDFIIWSVKTSSIPSVAYFFRITLVNYDEDGYIFLHDRNSQFTVNNMTNLNFNVFFTRNGTYPTWGTPYNMTYFSPYYSFRTTEGKWINSDSQLTTTYFYYVAVHYIRFNDNDPEEISIMIDTVDAQNLEAYRLNLKSFGEVYDAKEWVSYLNYLNRPSLFDKIVDAFINFANWLLNVTGLGAVLGAIGKFINDTITFLAPYLEAIGNFILEAIVFIIAFVVYVFAVWIMWNFVQFWVLLGEGKTNEAIEKLSSIANKTTQLAGKIGTFIPSKRGSR